MLPVVFLSAIALAFISRRLLVAHVDAIFCGFVLFGLLIGNRGFAQLTAIDLPLFPAEAALGLGVLALLWQSAWRRSLPIKRDAFHVTLFLWILLCAIRLPLDVRSYGVVAVRDFAMVYYGVFFFLGHHWGSDPDDRRWLERCTLAGLLVAPFAFEIFKRYPEIVVSATQLRGVPLIFIKGDSAAALMAGGAAWCACLATTRDRLRYGLLAFVLLTAVLLSNSRAALVALLVLAMWLAIARAWGMLRALAAYAVLAVSAAFIAAAVSKAPWHETELYRTYERVVSMTDFSGTRTYRSAALQDKGDNNDFRLTWWRITSEQTWTENKWLGVGFGNELASEFARIYYPEVDETFTARSPHNFVLSVFARSGLLGLSLFLVALGIFARRTWLAARSGVSEQLGLWLFGWGIFVSACFGVVLEGPMGAVIFWTVLGLASTAFTTPASPTSADVAAPRETTAELPAALAR